MAILIRRADWRDLNVVRELADSMGPGTLVVRWPDRDHYNITRYVFNYNHVARMGGVVVHVVRSNAQRETHEVDSHKSAY